MKRVFTLAIIVAVLLTLSGCYLPFIGEWRAQQDIKENERIEQEILANLMPAERFEITNTNGLVLLTQDDVEKAEWQWYSMNPDEEGVPVVILTFTEDGAKKFTAATQLYCGQELPMLLDGEEIARPVINERITDGVAIVSGGSMENYEDAVKIAAKINSTKK